MADDATQLKILQLLDVLSVEVGAIRTETHAGFEAVRTEVEMVRSEMRGEFESVRTEMHAGFERVGRRLGNLETRVEAGEAQRGDLEQRVSSLEARTV
jgi:hypothetical protein